MAVTGRASARTTIATSAPGVGDDSGDGYRVGDRWVNSSSGATYTVTDVSVGAAVWKREDTSGGGGGLSDGDYGDVTVSGGGTVISIDAGVVDTAELADNGVTDAKLRDSAGLSVIGRSANSTGDPADIAAASDGDVLRRSGTTLGFGAIPESSVTNLVSDLAGKQPLDSDLTALAANSTNGMWARTGSGTGSARTLTAGSTRVTVTNGDGVSGNPTFDADRFVLLGSLGLDLFGDGSDGSATITGGTTTLTSDKYYTDLTIDASGILDTAGYRVHVSGTLTWNGAIVCNGASGGTGAAAGIGGGNQAGGGGTAPYAPGANGAAGRATTGNGTASVARANNWVRLRNGSNVAGNGGAASANSGGTSGACTPPAADEGEENADTWETGQIRGTTVGGVRLTSGQGGSAGGVTGSANSGSGGGGGGIVGVFARRLAGSGGAAQAKGGAGGNANNPGGGSAGGGGGGTGGGVVIRYAELASGASLPTVDVSGGTGGTGAGAGGTSGTSGTAGFSSVRCLVV